MLTDLSDLLHVNFLILINVLKTVVICNMEKVTLPEKLMTAYKRRPCQRCGKELACHGLL